MSKEIPILDFSNAKMRQLAIDFIRHAEGLHYFECRKCRGKRSLAQNAYLWGVVYPHLAQGLSNTWGEKITVDEAHEYCKAEFLARDIVSRETGEIVTRIPGSSAALDKEQFGDYLEKIFKMAGEYLGIHIPEPHEYGLETEPAPMRITDAA